MYQASKARLSRSEKIQTKNSASRGEISAKRTTRQPTAETVSATVVAIAGEANKELVRRFYREAINERDASACERLLTADFVHNDEARGRIGQVQAVEAFLTAFPDLRNEIVLILAEDDLVAAHQRWTGTHEGPFLGVEPTGRSVEFTSTALLRFRDGLIAVAWDEVDVAGLMAQLGSS
ncbi:MAG: ester cyclase [Solirubrobacterales bacterium]